MIRVLTFLLSIPFYSNVHAHYTTFSYSNLRSGSINLPLKVSTRSKLIHSQYKAFASAKEAPPLIINFGDPHYYERFPKYKSKKIAFFQTVKEELVALNLDDGNIIWNKTIPFMRHLSFANMHIDTTLFRIYGATRKGVFSISLDGSNYRENNFFTKDNDVLHNRHLCRPKGVSHTNQAGKHHYYLACHWGPFNKEYAPKAKEHYDSSGKIYKVALDKNGDIIQDQSPQEFITTPKTSHPLSGYHGGVWMSGAGIAATENFILFNSGNGSYIPNEKNYASSVLRIGFEKFDLYKTKQDNVGHLPTVLPESMEAFVQNIDLSASSPALVKTATGYIGATLGKDGWLRIFDPEHFTRGFTDKKLITALGAYGQAIWIPKKDVYELLVFSYVGDISKVGKESTIILASDLKNEKRSLLQKKCLGWVNTKGTNKKVHLLYSGVSDDNFLLLDDQGADIFTSPKRPDFIEPLSISKTFWDSYIRLRTFSSLPKLRKEWKQGKAFVQKIERQPVTYKLFGSTYFPPPYSFSWHPSYLHENQNSIVFQTHYPVITIHDSDLIRSKSSQSNFFECSKKPGKDFEQVYQVELDSYVKEEDAFWKVRAYEVSPTDYKLKEKWVFTKPDPKALPLSSPSAFYDSNDPDQAYLILTFTLPGEKTLLQILDTKTRSIIAHAQISGTMHFSQPIVFQNTIFVPTSTGVHQLMVKN